jgi:hypothetical protein
VSGRATPTPPEEPAEILAGVWELLDELPPASASARLTATTVEMAAVAAERSAATARRGWLVPAAVVTAALGAGIVAGRLTGPAVESRGRQQLPLVAHLDLVREAGSVGFLARMAGRPGPPPRLLLQAPGGVRREMAEFESRLDELEALLALGADEAAERVRQAAATAGSERRVELERAAREFERLSPAEQRQLAEVARALVDPARPALREAARVWHLWVAASDPADRRSIVTLDTDERIEWLDRRARIEARFNGRPRDGDRRLPPREGEGRSEGPPRRPPFRPEPPQRPAETRAAPR